MSDAYGAIVVGFSNDFSGDKEAIAATLSNIGLSSDGTGFVVKSDTIVTDGGGFSSVQYPSLLPTRPKTVWINTDGKATIKSYKELTDAEIEDIEDIADEELIPLIEIAKELSQSITKGTLYVTCCANERHRSVQSHYMHINADGSAERASIDHWIGEQARHHTERCNAPSTSDVVDLFAPRLSEKAAECVVSVYALNPSDGYDDWLKAWQYVGANYGTDAVCRNVLHSPISPAEQIEEMRNATDDKTRLWALLHKERLAGATHAFVQPIEGEAIFGISLDELPDE
jgi:hypothetical protein